MGSRINYSSNIKMTLQGEEVMSTLCDWIGRADELIIEYDAGVVKTPMLPENVNYEEKLTIIDSAEEEVTDNVCNVVEWDETVLKADRYDYIMAVCSGTIAGLIDVFYVGQFSLDRAKEWGGAEVNKFVMKVAELQGFKGGDLSDAIKFLEKSFRFAADSVTADFGGGLQHHLRDFSHHFSLGGLVCSLYTQFSGKVIGTDTQGTLKVVELTNREFIGQNFEEKLLFGVVNWFFHMVSDMDGSSASAGKGTGIPGPLVSLIKELSSLPCFRDKIISEYEFHVWVSKLFNGTLLAKRDADNNIIEPMKFDLRTEIGMLNEIGRQCLPVLINECLVRGLYFIRRLYIELKEAEIQSIKDLERINSKALLPFNNRVIKRMVTIASGTFTAIDMVDAAVRASIMSSGYNQAFSITFLTHINIVGVGRFLIACLADSKIVTNDIREAKNKRNKIAEEYEKLLSDFKCLSLDFKQKRALLSLERIIVQQDITSDMANAEMKSAWAIEWEKNVLEKLYVNPSKAEFFFLSPQELYAYIDESKSESWIYLMALEALCFVPYTPLNNDENGQRYEKLKLKTDYLVKDFVSCQNQLGKEDFNALMQAYQDANMTLKGTKKIHYFFLFASAVLAGATKGLYWYSQMNTFYNTIYPSVDTNSGMSNSLIACMGWLVVGGNASPFEKGQFVASLGSNSFDEAAIRHLADDGCVLSECCKILTFCKEVLVHRFSDYQSVRIIKNTIASQTMKLENQLKDFQSSDVAEMAEGKKVEIEAKIPVAEKSLNYLNSTVNELEKLLCKQSKVDALAKPM